MHVIVAALAMSISGQSAPAASQQPFLTRVATAHGIDLDAFCLVAAENGRDELAKLPLAEQSKLTTFTAGILSMIFFYSGGASARRTSAELVSQKDQAFSFLMSRPVAQQQETIGRCHDDMLSRTKVGVTPLPDK